MDNDRGQCGSNPDSPEPDAENKVDTANNTGSEADAENNVDTADTTGSEENPSGKSSTADESSIEALNWSDFEEDELQLSAADAALLQSIHSVLSDDGGSGAEDGVKNMSTSVSSDITTVLADGVADDDEFEENDVEIEFGRVDSAELMDTPPTKSNINFGTKRKREESPVMWNTLLVPPSFANNEPISGDLSSNAAVLDDGPIWAKGSKRYKFEENRRVNQKLTFGVLLSVVLALGLGLGNLVAYNECEAEHKATEVPCPMSSKVSSPGIITPTLPPILPTSVEPDAARPLPVPASSIPPSTTTAIPEVTIAASDPVKPMVDPKYSQHAEELSKVLKMLDELSRKIDRFENTTRQLSGIVMMRDEIKIEEDDPPVKKTKFTQLLSEVMMAKKVKKASEVTSGQVKTWRDKKEEVLEDIAGAVLEAMQAEEEPEQSTLLESSQVFSVDEVHTPPLEVQQFPQSSSKSEDFLEVSSTLDESDLQDSEDDIVSSEPEELLSEQEDQNAEDDQLIRKPKLKRETAIDLEDEDLELKLEPVQQNPTNFEIPEHKSNKKTKEDWKKEKNLEKEKRRLEQEQFRKQKEQGREQFRKQKEQEREQFRKQKEQEREQFRKQKEQEREQFRKQKEQEREQFRKQKEQEKLERKKAKYENSKHHKNRNDEEMLYKQKQRSDKVIAKSNSDWVTARAQNRESSRRASEEYDRKHKNWQTERSRLREEFRIVSAITNNNREI